jgi:hypothetical protein
MIVAAQNTGGMNEKEKSESSPASDWDAADTLPLSIIPFESTTLTATNGRHERMHRTLKEDTAKPPVASLRAQQSRFDNFRYVFNNERPHDGLNNQVPASLYHPGSVRLPRKLPEFTYPKGLLLRRVNNSGYIPGTKIESLSARYSL